MNKVLLSLLLICSVAFANYVYTTIPFGTAETPNDQAVANDAAGNLYIGTSIGLVRVSTSNPALTRRTGIIPIETGEGSVTAVCLNAAGTTGYFFTDSGTAAKVVSFNVATFLRNNASVSFTVDRNAINCFLDANGVINFVTGTSTPTTIVRFDPTNLVRIDSVTLQAVESGVTGGIITDGANHLLPGGAGGRAAIVTLNAGNMRRTGHVFTGVASLPSFGLLESAGHYWFGHNNGQLSRLVTSTGVINVTTGGAASRVIALSLDISSGFIYALKSNVIDRYHLSNYTLSLSLTLPGATSTGFRTIGGVTYVVSSGGFVYAVNLATMSLAGFNNAGVHVRLNPALPTISKTLIDQANNVIYVAMTGGAGIARVSMTDFSVQYALAGTTFGAIVADTQFNTIYAATGSTVRRVNITENPNAILQQDSIFPVTTIPFTTPSNQFVDSARNMYIAYDEAGGAGFIKFPVANSANYETLRLLNQGNENFVQAIGVDNANDAAYVAVGQAVDSANPSLVRIRLSDFVRVSMPQNILAAGDGVIRGIVVQTPYLYLVSQPAGGNVRIITVDQRTNMKNATITTTISDTIVSGGVAVNGNFMFLTTTTTGRIIRIAMSDLVSPSASVTDNLAAGTNPIIGRGYFPASAANIALFFAGSTTGVVVANCLPGFVLSANRATCDACPAGTFGPDGSQNTCQTCTAGNYCPTTATVTPITCIVGAMCPAGSVNPTICSPGTYQTNTGQSVCIDCPAGQYCPSNQTNPINCPAGTFNTMTKQASNSSCIPCNPGTASAASPAATNSCSLCAAGNIAPFHGMSACTPCYAGQDADITRTYCNYCAPGWFNPTAGQTCQTCAGGTFSSQWGAIACTNCKRGEFNELGGRTSCSVCPAGHYSGSAPTAISSTGSTICSKCPQGKFAAMSGAIYCEDCASGFYTNTTASTTCLQCPAGFTSGSAAVSTVQVGQQFCTACSPGTFLHVKNNTVVCTPCASGHVAEGYAASSCVRCPVGTEPINAAGTVVTTGGVYCSPCNKGSYNPVAGTACLNCPIHHYQPMIGQASCLKCIDGYLPDATRRFCTPCQPGTFRNQLTQFTSDGSCQTCANGYVAADFGADNCTKCPAGYESNGARTYCTPCAAGTYDLDGTCTACPAGSYQDQQAQTMCKKCPVGFSTEATTGRQYCTACNPGTFAPVEGSQTCHNCFAGFFTAVYGASVCDACPAGYSSGAGSTICNPCAAGFFSEKAGSRICDACTPGFYQPSTASTSCLACPAGFATGGNAGQAICSACARNTYTSTPGTPSCFACGLNRYTTQNLASTNCTTCPPGYGISAPGVSTVDACLPCALGTHSNGTSAGCINCPAGTYQDEFGQTGCKLCPAGTFSGAAGATGMSTCGNCNGGFYSGPGATSCKQCPHGSYAWPAVRHTTCRWCPAGHFFSLSPGSNQAGVTEQACLPCPAGTYSARDGPSNQGNNSLTAANVILSGQLYDDNNVAAVCINCPAGMYSRQGWSACEPCPFGTYSNNTGAAMCATCPGGTFAEKLGSVSHEQCTQQCPPGFYANQTVAVRGQNLCTACPAGTYWTTNSTVCSLCPAGTFNSRTGQTQCSNCTNSTAIGATQCCTTTVNGNTTSVTCVNAAAGLRVQMTVLLAALALVMALIADMF